VPESTEIAFTLPAGTRVHDEVAREWYAVEKGGKRILGRDEVMSLMSSAETEAGPSAIRPIAAMLGLLSLSALWYFRRRKSLRLRRSIETSGGEAGL
jgi:hypothetical protein